MKNFVSVDSKTSLAEEWKRTRENELRRELKGNTANPSEDGKSLYERLQEQRREKAQKEMDESRDANVIRVLNNEDLEFLTAAEEARKAHSEALRRDTEARLEAFRRQSKALQSEHPNIDPKGILQLNPKAINVKTSKQKELLKMAIRKKK